jgi:Icc-related predicted phosphoesterase
VKILAVADKLVDFIYSPCLVDKYGDVDVVLSCGDLPYYYLEYIVTMLNVPLLYVHGNHDPAVEYTTSGQTEGGPSGCVNIHRRLVRQKSLAVVGLEGSIRYKPEGRYQYTDAEMWGHVLQLAPRLLWYQLITHRRLDILIAHAPPYGIHDGHDPTHVGFRAFLWLMRSFKPRYFIHGHRHVYNPLEVTETRYGATTVINVYPYKALEIDVDGK